jgi:hypothetical protein
MTAIGRTRGAFIVLLGINGLVRRSLRAVDLGAGAAITRKTFFRRNDMIGNAQFLLATRRADAAAIPAA